MVMSKNESSKTLNKRLDEMETICKEIKSKLHASNEPTLKINSIIEECDDDKCNNGYLCEHQNGFKRSKEKEMENFIGELTSRLINSEKELREWKTKAEKLKLEIVILKDNIDNVKISNGDDGCHNTEEALALQEKIKNLEHIIEQERTIYQKDIETHKSHEIELNNQLNKFKLLISNYEETIREYKIKEETNKLQTNNLILHYEEKIKEYKSREKTLKNEISDLKGSIRVFCRIRNEDDMFLYSHNCETIDIKGNERNYIFSFDKIFDSSNSQADIYYEISFLIHSALEGYKTCIFAYGQTGSGKTYTMEGTRSSPGIIPRTASEIFHNLNEMKGDGWKSEISISYFEIYNEEIKDLLTNENLSEENDINRRITKCEIKHDQDETTVTNIKYLKITTESELLQILNQASYKRSKGATECNDKSSRSHSVFTIQIKLENGTEVRKGVINLIDLAGSERLNESKATGERLKETQNINKSLSSLGNVITAISRNEGFIPFRDSKLTYYLKNYLSNNSKMLMIVNISTRQCHLNETLCSLRFAQKVSECKLGKASKNIIKRYKI
ncbi:Kinesin-like protein KIN-14M [Astathelohania contejeani]|uniref:Kinesin-like protein n=1 Tax=Astathelohania contejeani TaxID=164912 RepID=A0ABQ7I1V6_9MICR|nr:Kinesin-like protein KIN-14M [Thelohania contejeani]